MCCAVLIQIADPLQHNCVGSAVRLSTGCLRRVMEHDPVAHQTHIRVVQGIDDYTCGAYH